MPKNRVAPARPRARLENLRRGTAAARGACSEHGARAAAYGFEYDTFLCVGAAAGFAQRRRRGWASARARAMPQAAGVRFRAPVESSKVHDVQRSAGGERRTPGSARSTARARDSRAGRRTRVARRAATCTRRARRRPGPRERACPAPDRDGRACCLMDGRRDVYLGCDAQRHAPRQEERREVLVAVGSRRENVLASFGSAAAPHLARSDTAIGRSSIERSAFWKPTARTPTRDRHRRPRRRPRGRSRARRNLVEARSSAARRRVPAVASAVAADRRLRRGEGTRRPHGRRQGADVASAPGARAREDSAVEHASSRSRRRVTSWASTLKGFDDLDSRARSRRAATSSRSPLVELMLLAGCANTLSVPRSSVPSIRST